MNEAYNHFFFHYTATPLLVVETSQFDRSWGDEALDDLVKQLQRHGPRDALLRAADEIVQMSDGGTDGRVPNRRPDLSIRIRLISSSFNGLVQEAAHADGGAAQDKSRVPEGLWVKCPSCCEILYNKDLAASLHVCPKCGHHFRMGAADRLKMLFDGDWTEYDAGPAVDRSAEVHRHQAVPRRASRRASPPRA